MATPYDIPNNLVSKEYKYTPNYLSGFEHFNYFNSDESLTDSSFDNWVLGLFDQEGQSLQVFNTLNKITLPDSSFRFSYSFNIDTSHEGKVCFFAIYNHVDSSVIYQSNFFAVIGYSDLEKFNFFKYRNSSDLDNYDYSLFNEEITVFLDLDKISFDYEYQLKNYREESTGIIRRQKSQKSKYILLEAYFFDEQASDAMSSLCDHDNVYLNNSKLNLKEGFTSNIQKDMGVTKGTVQFYLEDYNTVNLKG